MRASDGVGPDAKRSSDYDWIYGIVNGPRGSTHVLLFGPDNSFMRSLMFVHGTQ